MLRSRCGRSGMQGARGPPENLRYSSVFATVRFERDGYKTSASETRTRCRRNRGWAVYFAEQGVGFHPPASGSFLKSVVVRYGPLEYTGSSTFVVTVNQRSPFGIALRS